MAPLGAYTAEVPPEIPYLVPIHELKLSLEQAHQALDRQTCLSKHIMHLDIDGDMF